MGFKGKAAELPSASGHRIQQTLSAPKSQRFLRFAVAMPIADPEIASDFQDKTKQCGTRSPFFSVGFLSIWLRRRGNR